MTHEQIELDSVDIYECPEAKPTTADQISIGDLHANAMLFMFFLVRNGVVKISKEQYEKLQKIYIKDPLDKSNIEEFNKILDGLEIGKKPVVRLIGDEIADRGQNDYFIFKILEKLKKSDVKTEILLSNHGIEFITPYEKEETLAAPNINFNGQAESLNRMRKLIEKGIITQEEVTDLVKETYAPSLKLISYSLHEGNITIYSHAGIGLETIKALADKFKDSGVVYQDHTVEALAQTIEKINAVFEKHVKDRTIHKLPVNLTGKQNHKIDPVTFVLWNRNYSGLSRNAEHNGYKINYVHGHDSGEPTHDNIFNLDSTLGKHLDLNEGTHKALSSQGGPLLNVAPSVTPERGVMTTDTSRNVNKNQDKTKSAANISMMVLGGFIAAVGIAAVAIAFTVLNAATLGVAGLVMAGIGIAATLSGVGIFAAGVGANKHRDNSDSSTSLPLDPLTP